MDGKRVGGARNQRLSCYSCSLRSFCVLYNSKVYMAETKKCDSALIAILRTKIWNYL